MGVTEKDGMHPLLLHANCLLFLCALYTVLAEANRVTYGCMSLCIEHVYCWGVFVGNAGGGTVLIKVNHLIH